jgi:accessory gene regulator protein AgrB
MCVCSILEFLFFVALSRVVVYLQNTNTNIVIYRHIVCVKFLCFVPSPQEEIWVPHIIVVFLQQVSAH